MASGECIHVSEPETSWAEALPSCDDGLGDSAEALPLPVAEGSLVVAPIEEPSGDSVELSGVEMYERSSDAVDTRVRPELLEFEASMEPEASEGDEIPEGRVSTLR